MLKFFKGFFLYLLILFFLGFKGEAIMSLNFILLHEITHYIVARIFGFSSLQIKILPFGAVLNLKDLDEADPFHDFIIAISGPIFNIIMATVLCYLYYKYKTPFFYDYALCNWILGTFNLIPAFPLDGGRILRDFLSLNMLYKDGNKITLNISISIGILLLFIYFLCFFRGYNNLSLSVGIISLFILTTSIKERERVSYIIMGDIVKKKLKFKNRGYIENRNISIYYKNNLLKVLELMDKNKYNVFFILDENMNLMDIIYEDEVIEVLKTYGNLTLKEVMELNKF